MPTHSSARYAPVVIVDHITEQQPDFDSVEGLTGLVYICPECGGRWATITLFTLAHRNTAAPRRAPYRAVTVPCVDHGGGSVLDKWVYALSPWSIPRLNPQLAAYEMEIELIRCQTIFPSTFVAPQSPVLSTEASGRFI